MASYKQMTKGNWKVTISLGFDGEGKRKKVIKQGFKTKKEAELYATKIMNQNEMGYVSSVDSNILFKDYIIKWYEEYKQYNIGINTRVGYLSRIKTNVIPLLGRYKLNQLNNQIIQEF